MSSLWPSETRIGRRNITSEIISDPIAGIAWTNKHIQKTEYFIGLSKKKLEDDPSDTDILKALSRYEYSLLKWGELLEHFIRQAYQQGKSETDISKAAKKVRMNAKS